MKRRKSPKNKMRTVSGYTKVDGTKVGPYKRRKVPGRKYRSVN